MRGSHLAPEGGLVRVREQKKEKKENVKSRIYE